MKKYIGIFAVCLSVVSHNVYGSDCYVSENRARKICNGMPDCYFDTKNEENSVHIGIEYDLKDSDSVVCNIDDTPSDKLRSVAAKNNIVLAVNGVSVSFESSIDPINESGKLNRSRTSRKVAVKDLCQRELGATTKADTEYCEYISPIYGICDTHAYNAGLSKNPDNDTDRETMDDIIATKVTVLSQQMYKQYEYLSATLHRIETQLNKAVLTAQLQIAGAKSDSSGGSSRSNDKEIVLAGAGNCWNESSPSGAYRCIQQNANLVKSNAQTNRKQAREQLEKTIEVAERWGIEVCNGYSEKIEQNGTKTKVCSKPCNKNTMSSADDIIKCANTLSIGVARALNEEEKDRLKYSSGRY